MFTAQEAASSAVSQSPTASIQQEQPAPSVPSLQQEPVSTAFDYRLLLGKVYTQWKGHNQEAEAVYDALIKDYPDDFRGYLAKGLLLK